LDNMAWVSRKGEMECGIIFKHVPPHTHGSGRKASLPHVKTKGPHAARLRITLRL
jgi:hypothetical protein